MFSVNVSPDMGMYHLLRNQGYDPGYALAEFVDNALQAHEEHQASVRDKRPLTINIRIYSADFSNKSLRNRIEVSDDGPGIKKSRLADAMKPAKPPAKKGLSEFGIGMKAAAVWFTDVWELATKPTGSGAQYALLFDLSTLVSAGSDTVTVAETRSSAPSGTTIRLIHLRRPIDSSRFDQICSDLTELYQRFTAGPSPRLILTAQFNDTPRALRYEVPSRAVLVAPVHKLADKKVYAVGKARKWQVPVKLTYLGFVVEGFVCLLERGSYVDNPGLVMFRGDRVIQGTVKKPNLPGALFRTGNKYSRQRVYGQLFADGLPVTYTKDAFEIDFEAFAAQLRTVEGMDDLLRQAEEYRANKEAIPVPKLSDIPGAGAGKKGEAAGGRSKGHAPAPTPTPAPTPAPSPAPRAPAPTPPPKAPLLVVLEVLRANTSNLAVQALVDETVYQHQFRREIATAMCLRAVVELATLDRIRRKLPRVYPVVEDKAIKSLLNYMNSNRQLFFSPGDKLAVKCVEGLALGTLGDVILLNNAAHGHYQPTLRELNNMATTLEPLIDWVAT